MAERRMFSKEIIDSDAFLEMPVSSQNLYFHLGMRADDDGFVNKTMRIMADCKASADDLKVLITKKYILPFDGGIVAIKHWRIHNLLRKDRHRPTKYQEFFKLLQVKENQAYTMIDNQVTTNRQPSDNQVTPQDSIGKVSIGEVREGAHTHEEVAVAPSRSQFVKPSLKDIQAYCNERGDYISAEAFFYHYESNGWRVGKTAMKDWQSAVRGWEVRHKAEHPELYEKPKNTAQQVQQSKEDKEMLKQHLLKQDKQWLSLDKQKRALTIAIVNGEDRQAELDSVIKAMAQREAELCN